MSELFNSEKINMSEKSQFDINMSEMSDAVQDQTTFSSTFRLRDETICDDETNLPFVGHVSTVTFPDRKSRRLEFLRRPRKSEKPTILSPTIATLRLR